MSLNVCDSEEDHFIIPLRELSTGKVHRVECLHDLGFFFTGYQPEYRVFFKDEWEIVRQGKRENNWALLPFALISGLLVLGAMVGIILDLFFR